MEDSGLFTFFYVGFFSVSLFLFGSYVDRKKLLLIAISIITVFMAIRYNWGSDYLSYYKNFNTVSKTGASQHFEIHSLADFFIQDHDIGWYYLVYLFSGTSYYFFIACLTVFEMTVIYYSIIRYVDKKCYWLAFSIFVFHPYILLLMVAILRQFLVQILFIIATSLIDKRIKLSFALMMAAVTIHLSALYFIPVVLITHYLNKTPVDVKKFVALIVLSYVVSYYTPLSDFLSFGNNRMEGYLEDNNGKTSSGIGILMLTIINVVLVACSTTLNRNRRLVVYLFSLTSIVYPFAGVVPILQRLTYFHIFYGFLAIPVVFQKPNINKFLLLFIFVIIWAFIIIQLSSLFETSIYGDGFGNYQTIFSAPDFM